MEELNKALQAKQTDTSWQAPQFFDLADESECNKLLDLLQSGVVSRVFDTQGFATSELFDIAYPAKKDIKTEAEVAAYAAKLTSDDASAYGNWVYYPWNGNLVHFPEKQALRDLRTSRNRNLITAAEQTELYKATVLVVGLSVGSSAVEMLLSQGIGGRFVLVDMDIIEPSNLNRIKVPYTEVGISKVDAMAKKISETDPYIEQIHYQAGLNEENIEEILVRYKPAVIIDEMDSLVMKLKLRDAAKQHRVPVIMATDDGDNALLDIERYDTDSEQQAFEGRIPDDIIQKILAGELSRPETGMLIGKYFVGTEHIPLRMFESLMEVGRTLPSWPQLAGAATLSGVALAYASRKIILGLPLTAGRHLFDLDSQLDPQLQSTEYKHRLAQFTDHMK